MLVFPRLTCNARTGRHPQTSLSLLIAHTPSLRKAARKFLLAFADKPDTGNPYFFTL